MRQVQTDDDPYIHRCENLFVSCQLSSSLAAGTFDTFRHVAENSRCNVFCIKCPAPDILMCRNDPYITVIYVAIDI